MSNIDKIRQEIERRKKICEGIFERESDTYYQGKAVAYGELLPFIDSLPEEKPSEDLNDEIKKFIEEYGYERGEDKLLIAIVARHFAEWQAEKCDEETSKLLYAERQTAYINGWHDCKEQMMKDAVEGFIICYNDDTYAVESCCLDNKEHHHHSGDKVKLIIVKQDDRQRD